MSTLSGSSHAGKRFPGQVILVDELRDEFARKIESIQSAVRRRAAEEPVDLDPPHLHDGTTRTSTSADDRGNSAPVS